MAIVNPRTVNEFGFQYIWYFIDQQQADNSSGLIVNDAFSGGGASTLRPGWTRTLILCFWIGPRSQLI